MSRIDDEMRRLVSEASEDALPELRKPWSLSAWGNEVTDFETEIVPLILAGHQHSWSQAKTRMDAFPAQEYSRH